MPSNTHTVIGGTKRFECRVTGHPRPEIRWFKDGRDITRNERYSFSHTYDGVISMIMENIDHNDQGNYRCRAENSEGLASTSAYLLVKAHKEHPDEEIEEVHAMELEEHFMYKSEKDSSIVTENLKEDKMNVDAVRKRTFEQVVDDERENIQIFNGTVSKESAGVEKLSYSKSTVNGYEETEKSSSKKMKSTSEESSSVIELGAVSEYEQILQLESSKSKASSLSIEKKSKSSFSSKSEKEVVFSSSKVTEKNILSASASVEETQVKAKKESKESAMIVGVSVKMEEPATLKSEKESRSSLIASVETEESKDKSKGLSLSVDTSEGETSSKLTKQLAESLITTAEIEEEKQEVDKAVLSREVTSETTRKEVEEGRKLTTDVNVEEVPEECQMELQGVDDADDMPQNMTDSAPTSLCNDSGFMESSVLESSLLQAAESMLENSQEDSTVGATITETTADNAKVSAEKDTKAKARTLKEESHVEETVISETPETTELSSVVQESEISEVEESKENVTSATKVTHKKEASRVKEMTEDTSAYAITTPTTAGQARVEEEAVKMERTSILQEMSHADETTELTSGGDITGLLDEKPDPVTMLEEEEVAVAEDQQEQRARWVDQITTRTETLTMEGEGKKVDELKAKDEIAIAAEKHEYKPELSTTSTEISESCVDAESLVARQGSVVDELPIAQADLAATNLEGSKKQIGGHQTRLEVDEGLSAQNILGLERAPTPNFEDIESSVDSVQPVEKEAEAAFEASEEDHPAMEAELDMEETRKAGHTEDELKLSAEATLSEGEDLSAPRIVSVPDDVSVVLGQAIHLVSQVQGNPQPEVKWFKEGDTVKAGERITLQTEDDIFTLEINDAALGDGGTYTLTAHNSEGTIFSDVLVTVSVPPSICPTDEEIRVTARMSVPEFVMQPGNVTVKELGALQLVCTIKANPSPTVVWNKDGKLLKSDSHVSIFESEGQYYLEIHRAAAEDAGEYTCTASNSEGSVSCSVAVFVESQENIASEQGAAAMVPLSQRESSSDVSSASVDSATTRYLKLVAAAAAFSLAAFGVKKVMESLPK